MRRLGLALRYIGEDVTWDDRPGTYVKNPNLAKTLPEFNLLDGESIHGELFPVVWQRQPVGLRYFGKVNS